MDSQHYLLIVLILISGFLSGSETSIFSLSKVKLKALTKKNPKKGKLISKLLENPQQLLITILMCNLFANILATLIAISIFPRWMGFMIITVLILIFGEITPKAIAIKAAPKISIFVAPVLNFLSIILRPFIFIFKNIVSTLVNINSYLFYNKSTEPTYYNSDEIIEIIEESRDDGIITTEESNILGNLLTFSDSFLSKIAKPRNEIFSLSIDTILIDIIKLVKEKKYSRIPIWEETEDNIVGILYIKDLLKINSTKRKLSYYKNILKKPFFVPDSVKAEYLLRQFQATRSRMAIVINEYGGIFGLVTLEDLLEEIIGEVVDKDDIKPLYYIYNPYVISVEGRMEINELNIVFKINLKDNQAATINGFILNRIKKIPEVGETFIINNLSFKITGATPNKIENILITKIKKIKKKK